MFLIEMKILLREWFRKFKESYFGPPALHRFLKTEKTVTVNLNELKRSSGYHQYLDENSMSVLIECNRDHLDENWQLSKF